MSDELHLNIPFQVLLHLRDTILHLNNKWDMRVINHNQGMGLLIKDRQIRRVTKSHGSTVLVICLTSVRMIAGIILLTTFKGSLTSNNINKLVLSQVANGSNKLIFLGNSRMISMNYKYLIINCNF